MDIMSPAERSRRMKLIRSKDTAPEMRVRKFLHGQGLRYSTHSTKVLGKPDIAFPKQRVAIFIHGCFWHMHSCPAFKVPSTRTEFWMAKLTRNRERDTKLRAELEDTGWVILEVWECELSAKSADARLAQLLAQLKQAGVKSKHPH